MKPTGPMSLSPPTTASPFRPLDRSLNRVFKRLMDLTLACAGLLALAPLFLIIPILIKLDSPGPAFYVAKRVGRHGRPFRLYKFRTMHRDADREGPGVTRAGDERITRMGHFLRQTKLDELPQLINVVKGEMSLVGPRPEDPRYVAHYTPQQEAVLSVAPGITSLASIRFRNEETLLVGQQWERIYIEKIMPEKIRIDVIYLDNWSPSLDLRILLYTFFVLPSTDEKYLL